MSARVLLFLAIAAAACSEPLDKPVDPVWGKQPCAHCAMLVEDPRTAAEVVTADKKRLFFDDVGCMVVFANEQAVAPLHMWVHAESGWADARTARYAPGASTPMDYGWIAAEAGSSFEEMRAQVLSRAVAGGER